MVIVCRQHGDEGGPVKARRRGTSGIRGNRRSGSRVLWGVSPTPEGGLGSLMVRSVLVASVVLQALALVAACSKKDDSTSLAPAASALTASKADSTSTAWHYVVDPKSRTTIDMPGVKEHIKADTSAAAGTFEVTPGDLSQSRGLVRIDLTTFATHTFGTDDDATQTKHALTWLEVSAGEQTSDKTSEPTTPTRPTSEMRWADFAIRSIDGASATDLGAVEPMKDGVNDVRKGA